MSTGCAHHDVELPLVTLEALERLHVDLELPPMLMRVNNRKLAQGFYSRPGDRRSAGGAAPDRKIDKIGPERVAALLGSGAGLTESQTRACVRLAGISATDESFVDRVRELGVEHAQLDEGLSLLADLVRRPPGTCRGG